MPLSFQEQNFFILATAAALIVGMLGGKWLVTRYASKLLRAIGVVLGVAAFLFGKNITSWMLTSMIDLGANPTASAYLAVAFMGFVGGLALAFVFGEPKPPKPENSQ